MSQLIYNLQWEKLPPLPNLPRADVYRKGQVSVIVAIEDGCWHLSVPHPTRYPMWSEIKEARYKFVPNKIVMAMILPPKEAYVNIHPNCFHLWELKETKEEWLR